MENQHRITINRRSHKNKYNENKTVLLNSNNVYLTTIKKISSKIRLPKEGAEPKAPLSCKGRLTRA